MVELGVEPPLIRFAASHEEWPVTGIGEHLVIARSRHTQSVDPSDSVTQWLHSSVSVSTTQCPRSPSTCRAVDLPVPDMPVISLVTWSG
jgi:hypothetical protein